MSFIAVVALILPLGMIAQSAGSLADRVLVVRNQNSVVSKAVADDYVQRRGITNVLNIACQDAALNTASETMSYADFMQDIESPLRAYLSGRQEIDFIVLTKGIPIRISEAAQGPWGRCSLDSYLAAWDYDKLSGANRVMISDANYGVDYHGAAWANRFWNSSVPFSHTTFGGYLVTRLDGYTQADAIALTTRSLEAERRALAGEQKTGKILLDICPAYGLTDKSKQPFSIRSAQTRPGDTIVIIRESTYGDYNSDLQLASDTLGTQSVSVELEGTETFAGNMAELNGYVSWGSNDVKYNPSLYHSLQFAPGALSETAVSTSARTFLPTSGGQSLVADLLSQGVTGMKGYTDEPLLQAVASPTILFDRYVKGWTLAESFYAASNLVGWQDIVVGDPICRAWASTPSGINDTHQQEPGFALYPNPCTDIISIQLMEPGDYKIFSSDGRLMKADRLESRSMDLHELPEGWYTFLLQTGGRMVSKPLLKTSAPGLR